MGHQLIENVRKKYPGAYDDLDDQALAAKLSAKYPEYREELSDYYTEERTPPSNRPSLTPSQSFMRTLAGLAGPEAGSTFDVGMAAVNARGGANLTGEDVAGALAGQAGGSLLKFLPGLGKVRLSGTGKARDAAMVGETLGQASPAAKPSMPGVEGLQRTMKGGELAERAGTARRAGLESLEAGLGTPQGGGVGRPQELRTLLAELAEAGQQAYNPAAGTLRTSGGVLTPLRERATILTDIERLLGPEGYAQFQQLQNQYARSSELGRLFEGGGITRPVLGPRGLNMEELQRRAGNRETELRKVLGPDAEAFLTALFRGGRPPVTDRPLQFSISRTGGQLRIPLFHEYLAGPGRKFGPYGGAAGAGLSRYLNE